MIRRAVILLLFISVPVMSIAQRRNDDFKNLSFREKLFFGGDFGLLFGTITDIELSPIIGYRLTRNLSVALGPKYEFYKDSRYYLYGTTTYQIKTHIYGGRAMLSYFLIRDINDILPIGLHAGLFAHTEYEGLSLENQYFRPWVSNTGRYFLNSILVGGGISVPLGQRGAFNIMVLWNLNETSGTPYANPVFRFGFTF